MAEERAEDKSNKKCFIVSSIGEDGSDERIHLEFLNEFIIKPVFENFPNYKYYGSLNIDVPGMIDSQIINHLLEDDLVIADMTFLNANVFYEIGVRHFARKPIIHTYRRKPGFRIPFDVQSYRAIEYDFTRPIEFEAAKARLRTQIEQTEAHTFHIDTPITRALGSRELKAQGSDVDKMILDRIESLENQVRHMRPNSVVDLVSLSSSMGLQPGSLLNSIIVKVPPGGSDLEIDTLMKTASSMLMGNDVENKVSRVNDKLVFQFAKHLSVDDRLKIKEMFDIGFFGMRCVPLH